MALEAQEAKIVAPLSPTLGQYGVSCPEFCQKFNDKTKIFNAGIPLNIKFFLLPDKKFEFEINSILFKECLNFFFNSKKTFLINFYKLFLIQKTILKFENLKLLYTILGSFKSFNFKTKLVLKQLKI